MENPYATYRNGHQLFDTYNPADNTLDIRSNGYRKDKGLDTNKIMRILNNDPFFFFFAAMDKFVEMNI